MLPEGLTRGAEMERVAESTGRDASRLLFGLFVFFSPLKMEDGIISVITDYGQLVTSSQSLLSPCLGLPAIRISGPVITGLTLVCA